MITAVKLPVIVWVAVALTYPAAAAAVPVPMVRTAPRIHLRRRETIAAATASFARRFLGVPYVWGGATPEGFDCSGLTRYVYQRYGIDLPHSTYAQWTAGRHITRAHLRPGDLVFFGLGHVGLWLGNGRFIHAPETGQLVSIARLSTSWYANSYTGAVRVRGSGAPPDLDTKTKRNNRAASQPSANRHR